MLDVSNRLITLFNPKSNIAEAYRVLRTNIQFSKIDHDLKTILVTAAGPEEGKTTNACNLAITFAQAGNRVLLIDGDMRKPSIHSAFNRSNTKGLSLAITEIAGYRGNIINTEIYNLDIMTSGPIPPNPVELLGSESFKSLLGLLKKEYDYIIIDSAPTSMFADAVVMSSLCDGTLFVVASGEVDKKVIKYAIGQLETIKANIIGVILNKARFKKRKGYYYYNYHSYGYGHNTNRKSKRKKGRRHSSYDTTQPTESETDSFLEFMKKERDENGNGEKHS